MINNKGMTLVEEIVALAIISIASLIMLVGFSTAANVFADSTRYKDITNKQYAALLGNENTDKDINVSNEDAKVIIKVADKVITVKTNQSNATSKKDSQTMLSKLNFNNINLSNTPQTVANCNDFLDSVLSFTTIKQFDEWIAEQGIDVASYNGQYKNNDCYRYYYYNRYGAAHLTLEQDIINECNRIFDEVHQTATNQNEKKARIGDKTLYIKPYFCGGIWQVGIDSEDGYFLMASELPGISGGTQWRTNLIYARGSWYYKVFAFGTSDQNSYVDVAGFSNAKATVDSLFDGSISEKINLSDQSQWIKIK